MTIEQTYEKWLHYCQAKSRTQTQDAALLTLAEVLLSLHQPGEHTVVVHPVVRLNGQEIPIVETKPATPQPASTSMSGECDKWVTLLEAYRKLKEGNEPE